MLISIPAIVSVMSNSSPNARRVEWWATLAGCRYAHRIADKKKPHRCGFFSWLISNPGPRKAKARTVAQLPAVPLIYARLKA